MLNVAGGNVVFEHEWFRCLTCDTTFRGTINNTGESCPVCHSKNIEHINGTLNKAVNTPPNPRNAMGDLGYCICPACGRRQKHQAGTPCKSVVCNECQVHYVRENSAHYTNINKIKKQKKHKN